MGLDVDEAGIGKRIAEAAYQYGVDSLNVLFLTPLPGTQLWEQMKSQGRIAMDRFPEDWKYYTLSFPVARYKRLSMEGIIKEMLYCEQDFYSMPHILRRVWCNLWRFREPLITLVGNFSYRSNIRLDAEIYSEFRRHCESRGDRAKESRGEPNPEVGAAVRIAEVSSVRRAGDGILETEKFKS